MNSSQRVKTLMRDISISDLAFFNAPSFTSYLMHLVSFLTRRYKEKQPRITMEFAKTPEEAKSRKYGAYTDGKHIVICGDGDDVDRMPNRQMKVLLAIGKVAHEYGHIHFTDFSAMMLAKAAILAKELFPAVPLDIALENNWMDVKEFMDTGTGRPKQVLKIWSDIDNILEDGYIEECDSRILTGLMLRGLNVMRKEQFVMAGEFNPSLNWSDPKIMWFTMEALLLLYAKYGTMRYKREDMMSPPILAVKRVVPMVDSLLYEGKSAKRKEGVNKIFLTLWPEIKAYLLTLPADAEETGDEGAMSGPMGSAEPKGSGKGKPVGAKDDKGTSGSKKTRAASKKRMEEESKDEGASGIGSDDTTEAGEHSPRDEADHTRKDEEGEVNPAESGEIEWDDAFEGYADGDDDGLAHDVDKLDEEIREKQASKTVDEELTKELEAEATGLDYGLAHRGMGVHMRRISSPSDVYSSAYETYMASGTILRTVSEMVRKIKPHLEDKKPDMEATGFYSGAKFDATRLVLHDCRYFKQRDVEMPESGISIAILVDLSGSMSGTRIEAAKRAAIILYLFCRECNVPVSVVGHTADMTKYGDMDLEMFADFDTPDDGDKFRLMDIAAHNNNRDGAAVLYAGEHLLKRHESKKLLIVISDGAPAASGYCGNAANQDVTNIVQELRRRGEIIFSAACGSDKPETAKIYGEKFQLDISNLEDMPNQLLRLVKNYMKR